MDIPAIFPFEGRNHQDVLFRGDKRHVRKADHVAHAAGDADPGLDGGGHPLFMPGIVDDPGREVPDGGGCFLGLMAGYYKELADARSQDIFRRDGKDRFSFPGEQELVWGAHSPGGTGGQQDGCNHRVKIG